MIVLSLFDGMSCAQIALKQLGVPVEKYYSSEIDKFAIKQTQLNFPDTIQLGDVNNWESWDIHWSSIDLVCAGSPCQGFSFAGKQLAFDDPRSKLFFVFVEILNNCRLFNPNVKFLLENVDMKKDHLRVISEYVGLFPVKINSALVSAQNRERWYWTDIRTKRVGMFNEIYTDIPRPKDKGILLKDILQPENEINKKYYLSNVAIDRIKRKLYSNPQINPDKTGTLNTKNNSGHLSFDSGTTLISDRGRSGAIKINVSGKSEPLSSRPGNEWDMAIKCDRNGIPKANQDKADSLTIGGHGCGNHSDMDVISVSKYHKKNLREVNEKANSFLATSNKGAQANGMTLIDTGSLRRLTPIECSRLQTIPEWYKWECSDSQIYRMLGNGWTVEVIMWIFGFMNNIS